ncbi:hypothetical protein FHG87_025287, partial [Trinorchestia longiramus]
NNNNSNYNHNFNPNKGKGTGFDYENKLQDDAKCRELARENRSLETGNRRRCGRSPTNESMSLRTASSACQRSRTGVHARPRDYSSDSNSSNTRILNRSATNKAKNQARKTNYTDLRIVNNIHCRLSHCERSECSKNSFAVPCPLHFFPAPPAWPYPCPAHGNKDPSRFPTTHASPLKFDVATSTYYAANPHIVPNPLSFDPRYHFATMPARGSRSRSNTSSTNTSRSRSTCRNTGRNPLVHCLSASRHADSDEEYFEAPG